MPKITVVVPTRNRPHCLQRLLGYYSDLGNRYQLVVADSSDPPHLEMNARSCDNADITCLSHLTYSPIRTLIDKTTDVLETIETPYVVLCADDDFVTPLGIERAAEFLSDNPDYSCAHGNFVGFEVITDGDEVDVRWQPQYPKSRSITYEKPEDRLHDHLSEYVATYYSLHRTPSLEHALNRGSAWTDDVRFGEILPSAITVVEGKVKHLDVLYGARYSADQLGATAKNMTDFVNEGTFEEKYDRFRECLAQELMKASDLSLDEAHASVDSAMTAYLQNSYGMSVESARSVLAGERDSTGSGPYRRETGIRPGVAEAIHETLIRFPVPEEVTATISDIYRRWTIPHGLRRKRFYLLLDVPTIGGSDEFARIRDSVESHPEAVE